MAEQAANELSGCVYSEVAVWVSWLNAYWNGPYPPQHLYTGSAFHVVLGSVDDYPLAIDMDPVAADSEYGKPRTDVLLAANMPSELESSAIPGDLRTRALSLGFALSSNTAGFCASGTQLRALHRDTPQNAALILVTVARLLSECARRAGAGPACPIP